MGNNDSKPTFTWYNTDTTNFFQWEIPEGDTASIGDFAFAYIDGYTELTRQGKIDFISVDTCHKKLYDDGIDGFFMQNINIGKMIKDMHILTTLNIKHVRLVECTFDKSVLLMLPKLEYLHIAKSNEPIDDEYVDTFLKIRSLNDLRLESTSSWFTADKAKVKRLLKTIDSVRLSVPMLKSVWDDKESFDIAFEKTKHEYFINTPDYTTRNPKDVDRFIDILIPTTYLELDLDHEFDFIVFNKLNNIHGFHNVRIKNFKDRKPAPLKLIERLHYWDMSDNMCNWICKPAKDHKVKIITCGVNATNRKQYERIVKAIGDKIDISKMGEIIIDPDSDATDTTDDEKLERRKERSLKIANMRKEFRKKHNIVYDSESDDEPSTKVALVAKQIKSAKRGKQPKAKTIKSAKTKGKIIDSDKESESESNKESDSESNKESDSDTKSVESEEEQKPKKLVKSAKSVKSAKGAPKKVLKTKKK
jgi:hypothetical protein